MIWSPYDYTQSLWSNQSTKRSTDKCCSMSLSVCTCVAVCVCVSVSHKPSGHQRVAWRHEWRVMRNILGCLLRDERSEEEKREKPCLKTLLTQGKFSVMKCKHSYYILEPINWNDQKVDKTKRDCCYMGLGSNWDSRDVMICKASNLKVWHSKFLRLVLWFSEVSSVPYFHSTVFRAKN